MPDDPNNEQLVKIIIDTFDETFQAYGEGLWAKPLGDDQYEIRNSPWHTFDVNFGDVVRAIPEKPDQKPKFVEVVWRSGHRTLHIYFFKEVAPEERSAILEGLREWKCSFENADSKLYAVDVEPDGNFDAACDYLDAFLASGKLDYRTTLSESEESETTED